jgi:outer membrane protein assembly factor BamA
LKRFIYIQILLTVSFSAIYASSGDSLFVLPDTSEIIPETIYVNRIIITGNEVTKTEIITREMATKENSVLDIKKLENDIQRVYNLGLFNKVDVIPVPETHNSINLIIDVEERFYILPIPQGGFKDGDLKKFWGGLNIIWNNFRGRNETLGLSFGIGYEPFVSLNYSVPWIGEKARFFTSTSIKYSKDYNRSRLALQDTNTNLIPDKDSNFAIYNFETSFTLGKYFTPDLSFSTTVKYNYLKLSEYFPGRTISNNGIDDFLSIHLRGRYDTRDSREYSLYGSYYTVEYQKNGFILSTVNFNRVNFDLRRFIPVKIKDDYSITFASRLQGSLAFGGTVPVYMRVFYGYNNKIRGWNNFIFEGENQAGLFSELRIPVIQPFYIKGTDLPVIKGIGFLKGLSYKFGLYTTVFFDVAGVWNRNNELSKTRFRNGFGAGLNFILPFGFVGSVEGAFRKEGKRFIPQAIFGLNSSF